MKFLYLIWRNLMRKPIRTLLNLLSIFIAFVLFGALFAVKTAFGVGVEIAGLDRLITIHKVSLIQPLPKGYGNKIEAVEGVASVAHATWFGGVYQDPKNFFAQFAVSPESYLALYPEARLPEEQKQAWFENRTGALVGRQTADRFGWQVGDRIPIQGTIWRTPDDSAWEFTIEGIYDADKGFDTTNFFFHFDYLAETTGFDNVVGWYILKIDDPERSAQIAAEIDRLFANSSAETKTSTEKAFAQGFANQIGNIGKIVISILVVVFFTLLLVSGNTMALSVRERINELGVLKTLGFTDSHVLGMVLGESYLVTLLGGGAGLALVTLLTRAFDLGGSILPTLYLPWTGVWVGLALLAAMGFISGAIPALQAQRLTIVDALRRT
ncbi:MAG: ABC transporter permease [bacterium]|nr:ABC transporter permease [bacterium]